MITESEKKKIAKAALYIRYLSLLAVEKAKSGHPGMPLGMADAGALLYSRYLNMSHDRNWLNRDRFVLSAGHGSILLYALEYVFCNTYSIEDIASFRQLGSATPGHPEHDVIRGVETSTGPLGQGFANAVGIALQGKILAEKFNTENFSLFDYETYVVIGDGCNMEGVLYEAASLAGHWKLGNLTVIYDSNSITIDGLNSLSYSENTAERYRAMGWHVLETGSENIDSIDNVLSESRKITDKPKLIIYKTVIGNGLNKTCASSKCHGAPVGLDEIAFFVMNSEMKDYFSTKFGAADEASIKKILSEQIASGKFITKEDFFGEDYSCSGTKHGEWAEVLDRYQAAEDEKYSQIESIRKINFKSLRKKMYSFRTKPKAGREIFSDLLQLTSDDVPNLLATSADLASSTKVKINSSQFLTPASYNQRNIAYGIREHAMGSINNGLAVDGIFTPVSSTFQVFSDYMRPSIRMAALMNLRHLFAFTHDSYMIAEDGPTHQPIEHINSLRIIPGLKVIRPCNDIETAYAYLNFLETAQPTALILSRQALDESAFDTPVSGENGYESFKRGAYVIKTYGTKPDCVIAASGYEVAQAINAGKILAEKGIFSKIISVPSFDLLEECGRDYFNDLFIHNRGKTFFIEPFCLRGIKLFIDPKIEFYGIDHFGKSGHADELMNHLGFTPEKIAEHIESEL